MCCRQHYDLEIASNIELMELGAAQLIYSCLNYLCMQLKWDACIWNKYFSWCLNCPEDDTEFICRRS